MESNLQPNPGQLKQTTSASKTLTGWGSFMGVLFIINGSILSLTVILALVGVPLIIAGVKVLKAVRLSKEMPCYDIKTGEIIDNLNSFFQINGIVFICTVVITIIGLVIAAGFGLFTWIQGGMRF
jgi:hypothetical protein